jgi:hypothetical protein
MSSHHFVKEGQEPALFILEEVSLPVIEPLLEWVPLILVADDILDHVLQWGIKIDVVIQHLHSVELLQEKLQDQLPIHIVPADGKFITKGLQFLNDHNQSSVNMAITTPTEDIIREIESAANLLQVSIYSGLEKWLYVTSCKFEKWMDEGQILSIRSEPTTNVETKGLTQYGSGWQTRHSGLVTLESTAPFWIRECL